MQKHFILIDGNKQLNASSQMYIYDNKSDIIRVHGVN